MVRRSVIKPLRWAISLILIVLGAALWLSLHDKGADEQFYRDPLIGQVRLFVPDGNVAGVVILLSDGKGWNDDQSAAAQAMRREGLLVMGIASPGLLTPGKRRGPQRQCLKLSDKLFTASQEAQRHVGLARYYRPVLAGIGTGGALAYAASAQSATGAYSAVLSIAPPSRPDLPLPVCGMAMQDKARRPLAALQPLRKARAPWIVLPGDDAAIAAIARAVPRSTIVRGDAAFAHDPARWMPAVMRALIPLLGTAEPGLDDLPLTEVPATGPASGAPTMAIFYSGDGGWAGFDRDLADRLARRGVPVVGVSSLEYFWQRRTARQSAADLTRIVDHYRQKWGDRQVLLIGFSFGADAIPFLYDALPADRRPLIRRVGLLAPSDSGDLQFHLASWLDEDGSQARPTIPAIEAMKADIVCVGGAQDPDNVCPAIAAPGVRVVTLPGGHHLGGDGDAAADALLRGIVP